MKTCATCRFWSPARNGLTWFDDDDYDSERESEHHNCVRIVHGNDYGKVKGAAGELAVVTDGSGYAASLRTLPTFGCVLHEESEAAK
jgi:hypothetical protein